MIQLFDTIQNLAIRQIFAIRTPLVLTWLPIGQPLRKILLAEGKNWLSKYLYKGGKLGNFIKADWQYSVTGFPRNLGNEIP